MHGIEDNYNWKTLKHWRLAAEAGNVQTKVMGKGEITDALLGNALKLLGDGCFPIAIICHQREEGKKEIWLTPLWAGIFDFLDDKRCLQTAEGEIRFGEMTDDGQKAILNARIASIWITGGESGIQVD